MCCKTPGFSIQIYLPTYLPATYLFTYQRDHGKYGVVGEFKKVELDTNIGSKVVLQENLDDALAFKKAMGEKYGGRIIGAHMMATSLVYTLSETEDEKKDEKEFAIFLDMFKVKK